MSCLIQYKSFNAPSKSCSVASAATFVGVFCHCKRASITWKASLVLLKKTQNWSGSYEDNKQRPLNNNENQKLSSLPGRRNPKYGPGVDRVS